MKIDKSQVGFPGLCPLLRRAYKKTADKYSVAATKS